MKRKIIKKLLQKKQERGCSEKVRANIIFSTKNNTFQKLATNSMENYVVHFFD